MRSSLDQYPQTRRLQTSLSEPFQGVSPFNRNAT